MMSSGNDTHDIISRGNDIKDKHRSEAHRALRESRTVDRVWNIALEELGRININFDSAWMSEYNKVYFDPLQLKRFCIVQIVVASLYSIIVVTDHPWGVTFETEFRTTSCFLAEVTGNHNNDPRTQILWTFLRLMGLAMNIVPAIATLVLLSSMRLREMVVQRLSSLAALHLMLSIIALFLLDVAYECRRVPKIFYSDVGLPIFNNYTYSGMTQDSCKDTGYNETFLRWNRVSSVGCTPAYGSLTVYFTFFSIGSSLNIGHRACASLTLVGCFVCTIYLFLRAMLLKSTVLWFLMAMLCLVSAQDAIQSYLITAQKKRDFMQLKVKKLMNVLTEKLIQTVIPPNVLDAMPVLQAFSDKASLQQSVSDVEFRAAWEIKMATMMFCSLDFDVSNVEDFDNMSRFLDELDRIIHASGMFKYQHVSTGSKFYIIINCPRVACPFDRELQEAEYPSSYYYDMVFLGWQLIRCTNEFSRTMCGSEGEKTIKMKVGVNCGSVAGIVLGKCRRFYCLYGDSMNVAARMSANAKESGLCVSPQIAAHLASAAASRRSLSAAASRRSLSAAASLPCLSSFPSVCTGSECVSAAVHRASAAGHTAIDVPSEELKKASMSAAETASDAGFRGLDTRNSTRNTLHVTPLHLSLTETRVTSLKDGHSSDVASREPANADSEAHASACATPRFSVVSRGLHPIKGKGLMELFDVLLVGAFDALLLDDGERGREGRIQRFGSTTAFETERREARRLDVSKSDLQALVDEETMVKKMMNYAYNLKDPKMEAEFLESQMYATRARMTGAVCLHSLFALWQMYAVMFPDFREYFMSHGSPILQWRMEVVGMLLYTQVFVAFFVSMGLILWLWRKEVWQLVRKIRALEFFASGKSRGVGKRRFQDQGALPEKTPAAPCRRNAVIMDAGAPETAPLTTMLGGGSTAEQSLDQHTMALAQCVLIFLLLFFHAMSVAAAQVWPQQSLVLAVFPAVMMLNFGLSHTINGLSKRQNLALVLYANLLLLPTLHKIIKNELVLSADHVMVLLGLSALSLAISLSFGFLKRRTFLNEYFLRKQLLNLGSILFDLVPPLYGLQLIKIEMLGYKFGQRQHMRGFHRVAALQLDICLFFFIFFFFFFFNSIIEY